MTRFFLALLPILAVFASACEPTGPEDHPASGLRYPSAIAVDPNGRYAYVLNTNFDSRYAGGSLVAVDLEAGVVLPETSRQTYSYGGKIIGRADADGGFDRLYFTTREGSTLTWAEVAHSESGPSLTCSETPPDSGVRAACSGRYVFGGIGADQNAGSDPFSVAFAPGRNGAPDHLLTGGFGGEVGIFRMDAEGAPTFVHLSTVNAGVYEMAVHPLLGLAYTSSKFRNTIDSIRIFDSGDTQGEGETAEAVPPYLVVDDAFVVSSSVTGREFGRGLTFNADGSLVYVAYRGPPAGLVVADTRVEANGRARNAVLGVAPLPESASGIAVDTLPDGSDRVYVTLFSRGQVAVVDPGTLSVVGLIDVGRGPFDIAIARAASAKFAVVTLFQDNALGIIDLEPTSTSFHREVRRIVQ